MKRVSALLLMSLVLVSFSTGCKDDSANATPTGFEMQFADCLVFGVHIFINDTYQGTCSSEEPKFYPLGAGTYTLFARSNANLGETYFCWTQDITVSDGNTTVVTLSCDGAECSE
jgi:hypothetical protein